MSMNGAHPTWYISWLQILELYKSEDDIESAGEEKQCKQKVVMENVAFAVNSPERSRNEIGEVCGKAGCTQSKGQTS